jgi:isopenicillin-N N-acyltransferase-like protein
MNTSIPLFQLKGSPEKVGKTHGEAFRNEIHELVQLLWEAISTYSPLAFSQETLLRMNLKNLAFAEEYGPDLVKEMRGIAEGAHTSFEEIFFLNSAFNLINLGNIKSTLPLLGCTTFGASNMARQNGSVYLGENYDTFKFFDRYTLVLRIEDGIHPPALICTIPGILANAGINMVGLGVTVNFISAIDVQFGRIPTLIIRKVLQSERIGDAIDTVISGKRACGANYIIGDGGGNIFCIETSSGSYDILPSTHGIVGHANHYRSSLMRTYQIDRPGLIGDSILRDCRINQLLEEKKKNLDHTQLMEILRDHANFPSSICFHGRRKEAYSDSEISTVFSMIQELKTRTLYISTGTPCKGEYLRFSL